MTGQLALSFAVWLIVAALIGRRIRHAPKSSASKGQAGCYAGILFVFSAAALFGGLFWIAGTTGPHPHALSTGNWLAITGLGALFTAGQGEAAGLLLRSIAPRVGETTPLGNASDSSSQTISEQQP